MVLEAEHLVVADLGNLKVSVAVDMGLVSAAVDMALVVAAEDMGLLVAVEEAMVAVVEEVTIKFRAK